MPPRPPSHRPPPDRQRGPRRELPPAAARLADRAAETDRAARFARRFDHLERARQRTLRRQRIVAVTGWTLVGLALTIAGWSWAQWLGVLAGAGATLAAAGAWRQIQTAASRRGATAWDWRSQRYRLYGDPSARVQALDDPEERAVGRFTGGAAALGGRDRGGPSRRRRDTHGR